MKAPDELALLGAAEALDTLGEDTTVSDLAHRLGWKDETTRRRAKALVASGLLTTSRDFVQGAVKRSWATFHSLTKTGGKRLVELEERARVLRVLRDAGAVATDASVKTHELGAADGEILVALVGDGLACVPCHGRRAAITEEGLKWIGSPEPVAKAGEIVHLDWLVERCGFFTSDTETFGGYGCLHPDQESRDPDTNEGQCDHCPLAWRLCPSQEEEDAALMVKQGYEPDNGDGKLLCMNGDLK
jgi:DNA-binding MarR family transcriptional regulator